MRACEGCGAAISDGEMDCLGDQIHTGSAMWAQDLRQFNRQIEEFKKNLKVSIEVFVGPFLEAILKVQASFDRIQRSTATFEKQWLSTATYGERFKYHAMRMGGTKQWRAFDILDEERDGLR